MRMCFARCAWGVEASYNRRHVFSRPGQHLSGTRGTRRPYSIFISISLPEGAQTFEFCRMRQPVIKASELQRITHLLIQDEGCGTQRMPRKEHHGSLAHIHDAGDLVPDCGEVRRRSRTVRRSARETDIWRVRHSTALTISTRVHDQVTITSSSFSQPRTISDAVSETINGTSAEASQYLTDDHPDPLQALRKAARRPTRWVPCRAMPRYPFCNQA
jgi:hypothetical protein